MRVNFYVISSLVISLFCNFCLLPGTVALYTVMKAFWHFPHSLIHFLIFRLPGFPLVFENTFVFQRAPQTIFIYCATSHLFFFLSFSLRTTSSVSFRIIKRLQHRECLSGETVRKCVMFSPFGWLSCHIPLCDSLLFRPGFKCGRCGKKLWTLSAFRHMNYCVSGILRPLQSPSSVLC